MLRRSFGAAAGAPFKSVRIMRTGSNNIQENLALEQFLFNFEGLKVPTLILWRNDKTIVIGKHQNPWKECFLDRIEADGVILARRKSGGGAVYHDLGNLCFSFLTPIFDDKVAPLDTRNKNNEIIIKALQKFDIKANVSGRNDLEVDGKKFSGSAYELDLGGKFTQKKALHHGTIMLDLNFSSLSKYLNPSKPKLKSKGISSVVSRVINLKDLNPDIDYLKVENELEKEFKKQYDWCQPENIFVEKPLEYNSKVKEIYEKWADKSWVIGETPEFTNNMETRFDWGTVDVYVVVNKGVISSAKVYSDCLVPDFIDTLTDELNSKHYSYSKEGIEELTDILSFKFEGNEANQKIISDLRNWLIKEL